MVPVATRHTQPRVDWFRILVELGQHGYSLHMLEVALGIPYSTLQGYKSGAEPRYVDGEVLAKFYCQVTHRERDEFPARVLQFSAAKIK